MRRFSFVLLWLCCVSSIAEASRADALMPYLGRWEGTRAYNLGDLEGTETFTMNVTRFRKRGLKVSSVITRPGWDEIRVTEYFFPSGKMMGKSGTRSTVYDVRSGSWQVRRGKVVWRWKMFFDGLREWTKSSTTWYIDTQGQLREVRVVPRQKNSRGGRVTAVADRVP